MIKSKAIDILKSLSPGEFKEFGKFVHSPYFNENKKLGELYGLLKKYYPDYSKRSFTKENVYGKLFPGRGYNDGTMRKLLSGIQQLAEEYLAHSNFRQKDHFQKKLALLYRLDEKKLTRLFEINVQELDEIYSQPKNFEDDYFRNNFELAVAKINFRYSTGRAGFEPEHVLNDLIRCATYLICYSMITAFKLNQDIMVTTVSYDFNYKNTIVYRFIENFGPEKFLDSFRTFAPEFSPVMEIYFNRFMIAAELDKDNIYYRKLKELVLKNLLLFTRFEKYNLMLFLENSCDEKIRLGKDFKDEMHEIHKIMLEKNLFAADERDDFSFIRFRKMILNALAINETVWVQEFVGKYLDRLSEDFRDNMYYYSRALLDLHLKQFGKALENISKVKFEVYTMKFDVWRLKLQTEFELDYYEEALYSVDSFRHSLKNDTTSPQWMKARFSNFMNYFQKIFKMKDGQEKSEAEILKAEISKSKEVLEKEWLLEKLADVSN